MTPDQPAPKPGSVASLVPTFVLVQTMEWNPEAGQDGPADSISVSIMVPVSGHEGRWLTKECGTAEELWNYLKALDRERDLTLAWNFDYQGPPTPRPPASVEDMLRELL